jgi:phosphoribosylaminoimidazole-succinocarboxamide synthase
MFPDPYAGAIAEAVRDRAIALYRYASAVAARAGIILADTKFEFGLGGPDDGEPSSSSTAFVVERRPVGDFVGDHLILIDEVLTPDSSRFWDAATYEPGRPQASFDKQYVRDWLTTQAWDKTDPGPALPDDVIAGTRARYVEAFERITGASFERYLAEDVIAR